MVVELKVEQDGTFRIVLGGIILPGRFTVVEMLELFRLLVTKQDELERMANTTSGRS